MMAGIVGIACHQNNNSSDYVQTASSDLHAKRQTRPSGVVPAVCVANTAALVCNPYSTVNPKHPRLQTIQAEDRNPIAERRRRTEHEG